MLYINTFRTRNSVPTQFLSLYSGLLADIPRLQEVLKNHVIGISVSSKKVALLNGQTVETLHGSKLAVKVRLGCYHLPFPPLYT